MAYTEISGLYDRVFNRFENEDLISKADVLQMIAAAPLPAADVVEVVRCKECEHATFYYCKNDPCYRGTICEYHISTGDENFFCSYGKRKEGVK